MIIIELCSFDVAHKYGDLLQYLVQKAVFMVLLFDSSSEKSDSCRRITVRTESSRIEGQKFDNSSSRTEDKRLTLV
jgi:hypothetical protein